MNGLRRFLMRLAGVITRRRDEARLREEIEEHLALQTVENIRAGLSANETRRQAILKFGAVEAVKEHYRDERRLPFLEQLVSDVRYAVRGLLKNPGFTSVAVLTLALCIGAASTLFSMLDAVVFRSLPFEDVHEVVEIWGRDNERSGMRVPEEIVAAIRDRSATIGSVATHGPDGGALRTDDGPVRIRGRHVSANYLNVLGVQPFLGRGFQPDEGENATSAVVSYRFWRTRFAENRKAIGELIYINDVPYTVVGVMPKDFQTSFSPSGGDDFWTTYVPNTTRAFEREQGYEATARLSHGRSVDEAVRELQAIAASVVVTDSDWRARRRYVDVVPKQQEIVGDSARALQMLFAAAALVLSIACTNLALLSLVRAGRRAGEFATRKALGATASRLFRLVMLESVAVAAAGAILGIALSYWLLPVMLALVPSEIPRITDAVIDNRVLSFAALMSVVTAAAFGVLPAMRLSRLSVLENLRGRTESPSARRAMLQGSLIAGQAAASVALLAVGILIVRTFVALLPLNPGFESKDLAVFNLFLPARPSAPATERARTIDQLLLRLDEIPGIDQVAYGMNVPFGGDDGFRFVRDLKTPDYTDSLYVDIRAVSANFFRVLGMPMVRGRSFTATDYPAALPRAAIVNETFARRLGGGHDVLGRRVQVGGTRTQPAPNSVVYEIIGVVGDARSSGSTAEIWNELYVPHLQYNPSYGYLVVRSRLDIDALDRTIKREIRGLLPQWVEYPWLRTMSMETLVSRALAAPRFSASLISAFSAVALMLTAVGVFGLVSYSVSQRRFEFGIRAALGASPLDQLLLTLRSSMAWAAIGVAVGLGTAVYLTQLVKSELYGVQPGDPITFITSAAVISAVATVAAYLPARRAARVDPLVALRYE